MYAVSRQPPTAGWQHWDLRLSGDSTTYTTPHPQAQKPRAGPGAREREAREAKVGWESDQQPPASLTLQGPGSPVAPEVRRGVRGSGSWAASVSSPRDPSRGGLCSNPSGR